METLTTTIYLPFSFNSSRDLAKTSFLTRLLTLQTLSRGMTCYLSSNSYVYKDNSIKYNMKWFIVESAWFQHFENKPTIARVTAGKPILSTQHFMFIFTLHMTRQGRKYIIILNLKLYWILGNTFQWFWNFAFQTITLHFKYKT